MLYVRKEFPVGYCLKSQVQRLRNLPTWCTVIVHSKPYRDFFLVVMHSSIISYFTIISIPPVFLSPPPPNRWVFLRRDIISLISTYSSQSLKQHQVCNITHTHIHTCMYIQMPVDRLKKLFNIQQARESTFIRPHHCLHRGLFS